MIDVSTGTYVRESLEVISFDEHQRKKLGAAALLKVMTGNVNGQPDWYHSPYPVEPYKQWVTRAPIFRKILDYYLPDIVGLQESGTTFYKTVLHPRKGDHPYRIVPGKVHGTLRLNDILYNADRISQAEPAQTIYLSPDGKFGKVGEGYDRACTFGFLYDRYYGDIVVANHYPDNKKPKARRLAAEKLIEYADKVSGGVKKVIITSDSNMATAPDPGTEDYYKSDKQPDFDIADVVAQDMETYEKLLQAGFVNVNQAAMPSNPYAPVTFNNYGQGVDVFGVRSPDLIAYRNEQEDRVRELSHSLAVAALHIIRDHIVLPDESIVYSSDHYPVMATFQPRWAAQLKHKE